jgi:hypothetical protein
MATLKLSVTTGGVEVGSGELFLQENKAVTAITISRYFMKMVLP